MLPALQIQGLEDMMSARSISSTGLGRMLLAIRDMSSKATKGSYESRSISGEKHFSEALATMSFSCYGSDVTSPAT
jgi:hypothetical protein